MFITTIGTNLEYQLKVCFIIIICLYIYSVTELSTESM